MEINRQSNGSVERGQHRLGRAPQSTLACDRCKGRKIKCDRSLPACRTCVKGKKSCSYPLTAHKPGPKPGAPQRKKRRLDRTYESGAQTLSSVQLNGNVDNQAPDSATQHQEQRAGHSAPPTHTLQRDQLSQVSPDASKSRTESPGYRGLSLSHLLHPSHEPQSAPALRLGDRNATNEQSRSNLIGNVCTSFQISREMYEYLLNAYFDNMTSFSIFHRPTFDMKLNNMPKSHYQALLAAMFSFSARFRSSQFMDVPSHEQFRELAERLTDEALRGCADDPPPLCILQALILLTFHQLTNGVRSQAWRSVGTLIRIAYELNLHIIDKNSTNNNHNGLASHLEEEKRRAWWAIWEFDVFASSIRRLPTSIDWESNETWLPIDDEAWVTSTLIRSCNLNPDPTVAWKELEKTGNKSPKAWFIVLNALMRCAHLLSYPQAYASKVTPDTSANRRSGTAPVGLEILANSLYCLAAAIPPGLSYQGEFLGFHQKLSAGSQSVQLDSSKHSIHMMTQLCRFMINHYQVFNNSSRSQRVPNLSSTNPAQGTGLVESLDKAAWNLFLSAASEIVTLVRNSAPHHIQYANPFLASTVWLAAAAHIVSRSLGTVGDRRVADSNLDLLQMNLNSYVSFWGISSSLQHKLSTLEAKLDAMNDHDSSTSRRQQPTAYTENAMTINSGGFSGRRTVEESIEETSEYVQPATNLDSSTMNFNQGFQSVGWSAPQAFELTNSSIGAEIDAGMWGWGLDELLAYGGLK